MGAPRFTAPDPLAPLTGPPPRLSVLRRVAADPCEALVLPAMDAFIKKDAAWDATHFGMNCGVHSEPAGQKGDL